MSKKVLIVYTNYGTGHFMAAKAIEEYLIHHYSDYKIKLLDPLSFSRPIINKFFAKMGKLVATKFRKFRLKMYQKKMYQNYFYKSKFDIFCIWLFWTKKLKKKLLEINPDIIISTQVGPTGLLASHKQLLQIKIISVFTDYGIHRMYTSPHELVDLFCVPTKDIQQQMIRIGISENKIIVTGIPVRTSFLEDKINKKEFTHQYQLVENQPILLFLCGGGLGYDNAFVYFKELLKSDYSFSYLFVAGQNEQLFTSAKKLANQYKKTGKIFGYVKEIDQLMKVSDFIIGKPGGIMTSEALNLSVPVCAIAPIPGQEIQNALFIEQNQFGLYIKNIQEFRIFLEKLKNKQIKRSYYSNNITKRFEKFSFDIFNIINDHVRKEK